MTTLLSRIGSAAFVGVVLSSAQSSVTRSRVGSIEILR
jgi:hypothetical protein